MTILITSDVHGRSDLLKAVIEKHKNIELHINAGDMCLNQHIIDKYQVITVSGNNDYPKTQPNERVIELNHMRIYMTHGHIEHVKLGLERLKKKATDHKVHLCIFGHTHKRYLNVDDNIVFVNPGSLGDGSKSYAIYEDGKVSFHTL
ncbi:MAG: metallophosphoesterase family protein [Acholeplasmataceae bacterium]